ncbi:MAG: SRPBCC family protein [Actinomycetia bacterium]|nr:SRPBCC family protein [Actinomycetes bacterium]MCP4961242.1 SRPBCC family protein [Actinomycetes bacterium]
MELSNEFRVDAPIDVAWAILTDVEGIAPCMPGAQLTEIDGDEFKGSVKVKVGPITAQYQGVARFAEKDDANHKAVIDGSGRDTRGQGNASALVTLQLTADGEGTHAQISTELKITGKVAQFGRGVMADVSQKLLGQFVECLEAKLADAPTHEASEVSGDAPTAEADPAGASPQDEVTEPTAPSSPRKIDMPEAQPVDLLDTAGAPLLKRIAPVLAVLILLFLLRRRRH